MSFINVERIMRASAGLKTRMEVWVLNNVELSGGDGEHHGCKFAVGHGVSFNREFKIGIEIAYFNLGSWTSLELLLPLLGL
jgi:hypothetical protein